MHDEVNSLEAGCCSSRYMSVDLTDLSRSALRKAATRLGIVFVVRDPADANTGGVLSTYGHV